MPTADRSAPYLDRSVDVVVMGSGAAGHCAALRSHDLGLDVLMLEK